MAITSSQIRSGYEKFVKPGYSAIEQARGRDLFVSSLRRDLGIVDDATNRPIALKKGSVRPEDFSIKAMAIALCGEQWFEQIGRSIGPMAIAFEDGSMGNAVVPGNIPNVSAFLGSVTGLLDARVLAGYNTPEYISKQLIPVIPTATRQTRMINVGRIGNQAAIRNPGEPHVSAQFQDRRVLTPETSNVALACHVTYEAVFFDQTGEVLNNAYRIGAEIGLYEEFETFRLISGVTNNYNYNGVAYNTYLLSGNWINDVATNELLDWTNVNVVYGLYSRFTDQESGNRVTTTWDTMLVAPSKMATAEHIINQTELQTRNPAGTNDRIFNSPPNDHLAISGKRLLSSPYLDQTLTNSATDLKNPGLALSQSDADKYWWAINTSSDRSAFIKTENWPFNTVAAAPNDFTAMNNKLVLSVFADRMAQFSAREPRSVVRSKA